MCPDMPSASSDHAVPTPSAAIVAMPVATEPLWTESARNPTTTGQGRKPVARPSVSAPPAVGWRRNRRKTDGRMPSAPSADALGDALRRHGSRFSMRAPVKISRAPAAYVRTSWIRGMIATPPNHRPKNPAMAPRKM